ncbi:MAG: DUF3413 domain-containing protein, partial [bacterium]
MAAGEAQVQGPLRRGRSRARGRPGSSPWFGLFALNATVAAFLARGYFVGVEPSPADRLYIALIWASHFGCVLLLLAALAWLVCLPLRRPAWRQAAVIALLSAFQVALFVDVKVYELYRYHLNAWVLTVVLTALGDSVHFGVATTALFAGVVAALVGAQVAVLRLPVRWRGAPRTGRAAAVILVLALADKALYAGWDLTGNLSWIRYTKLLPYYQTVTIKHFVWRHFAFMARGERQERMVVRNTMLNYPRAAELGCGPAFREARARTPNILIVPVESLRADAFTPEIMPNLTRFARDCRVFRNHFSGGNLTRAGLFALLYGLPGSYWKAFLAEQRGPVLIEALQARGYRFKILSSTRFTFPQFRRTAFVDIEADIEDELPGEDARRRDPELARRLLAWLDGRPGDRRPFFAFLFPDAPHSGYLYPPEFGFFQPTVDHVNFLTLPSVKDARPIVN